MTFKKTIIPILMTLAGAALLVLGKTVFAAESVKQIAGMCFGLGAALFALGLGALIGKVVTEKTITPEIARQKEIDVNDERNVRIRERVGARINQIMIYLLSALVLILGFMGADLWIILAVTSLFVIELVLAIVLTDHYSKEM
jgi:hypothetical protein